MSLLEVNKLAIGYESAIKSRLSFDLNEGEILLIKGKNGSGKSTLLKTILGEIPKLSGEYKWLIPSHQVLSLGQNSGGDIKLSLTMEELFECYGIEKQYQGLCSSDYLKQKWNESSGGERKKALILSKLQKNGSVLVLDEPFNHLDRQNIEMIFDLLKNLLKKSFLRGVIIVSHIALDTGVENEVLLDD